MKFKSNIFYEYTHLKDIEIPVNIKDVIERLKLQKGYCRDHDSNDKCFGFDCRDDGTVLLGDYNSNRDRVAPYSRAYALHGKLEEQGKKTVLKLYVYRTKGMSMVLWISAIILFLEVALVVGVFLSDGVFEPRLLLLIPFLFLSDGLVWFYEYREMTSWEQDQKIMLEALERRIKGVIRWED